LERTAGPFSPTVVPSSRDEEEQRSHARDREVGAETGEPERRQNDVRISYGEQVRTDGVGEAARDEPLKAGRIAPRAPPPSLSFLRQNQPHRK
ncbi:MAG TPA: hypothetical protein VK846_18630, partial [Candidatus Limnocylindria bacterium]|nr:hypothetical protein [Candidatus Limnocylindria bacterium]